MSGLQDRREIQHINQVRNTPLKGNEQQSWLKRLEKHKMLDANGRPIASEEADGKDSRTYKKES